MGIPGTWLEVSILSAEVPAGREIAATRDGWVCNARSFLLHLSGRNSLVFPLRPLRPSSPSHGDAGRGVGLSALAVEMTSASLSLSLSLSQDVMSAISSRIPTSVENEIQTCLSRYANNLTSVFCQFPSQHVRHIPILPFLHSPILVPDIQHHQPSCGVTEEESRTRPILHEHQPCHAAGAKVSPPFCEDLENEREREREREREKV